MRVLKLIFLFFIFTTCVSSGEITDEFPAILICTSKFNSVCITGCDDQKSNHTQFVVKVPQNKIKKIFTDKSKVIWEHTLSNPIKTDYGKGAKGVYHYIFNVPENNSVVNIRFNKNYEKDKRWTFGVFTMGALFNYWDQGGCLVP